MMLGKSYVKFVRWFWKGLEGKLNYQTGAFVAVVCLISFLCGFWL